VIQPRGMLRREVFDNIGLFDESFVIGEDYEFMGRFVASALVAVHLPKPLYKRRIRTGSLTHNDDTAKANSHFAAVDRLIQSFSHGELFPDVNWSVVPANKIAAVAKCLTGTTFLAMARNYHLANKPHSAAQALRRAFCYLQQSAALDKNNPKSRQLLRDCEVLRRQIILEDGAAQPGESTQEIGHSDDNSAESLNKSGSIMGI
ncbi:MAG TPA: hypothetical protein VLH60_00595, partial [Sedimentisphaerales bacterium]|nr:hypothetical protein [Sedimentisphaerales bacterium]